MAKNINFNILKLTVMGDNEAVTVHYRRIPPRISITTQSYPNTFEKEKKERKSILSFLSALKCWDLLVDT